MDGYTIREELHRGRKRVVYRAVRDGDQAEVILKSSLVGIATEEDVAAVRHEFDILSSLSVEGVPRVHALESDANALHLIMEDRGGATLSRHVATTALDLAAKLDLAIGLVEVLEEVHRQKVIHRDVNPSNVIVDEDGRISLIDFSISTRRAEERAPIAHPFRLQGTLAYLSPEQTGRMNRPVDYRSDFYSLGVTLFELFTGELPFQPDDAMQLVYEHIAVPAPRLVDVSGLPIQVSAVVAKLLEKAPEDRYQSARSILHDLRLCRAHVDDILTDFLAGGSDASERFSIPRRLYGRSSELREIHAAFEDTSRGSVELVLVAGYSGIGKSALVHQVQTPVTKHGAYFVTGKYDQLRLSVPHSAIVAALGDLVGQLLTEPAEVLAQWREKLLDALDGNGQLVIDVIPEVEHVIGLQPPVAKLDIGGTRNRFNLVFRNFMRVFCQPEHPLVMFLDDLQWIDPASLALIHTILTDDDTHHLLVIGAYRDNEVDDSHPLLAAINALTTMDTVRIRQLTVSPLSPEAITQLLVETLRANDQDVSQLQKLVHGKTGGNPFFLRQFLQVLHERGGIAFDQSAQRWKWDTDELEAMNITSNVVELMVERLKELPDKASSALASAACFGTAFELPLLQDASDIRGDALGKALEPAIAAGLIVPDRTTNAERAETATSKFRFLHDRVQQAALAGLTSDAARDVHLRIGLAIESRTSDPTQSDDLFQILEHLNASESLILDAQRRRRLGQLNLHAARRAVSATAYSAACDYAVSGLVCMPEDAWDSEYELTRDLHRVRADAEYLRGDFDVSRELIDLMVTRLRTPLEKAEVQGALVVQLTLSGEYKEAISTGCDALATLDQALPTTDLDTRLREETERFWKEMGRRSIQSLRDLPNADSPEIATTLRLLANLCPLCYIADPPLYRLMAVRMSNLSLRHGNTPDSVFGYAFFGLLNSSVVGDYERASEFGHLAIALSEKYSDASQFCRASHAYCAFINHWVGHLREFDDLNRRGFQAGLQSGELQFAGYHRYNRALCLFHLGTNLSLLTSELLELLRFSRQTRNQHAADPIAAVIRVARDLAGETSGAAAFDFAEVSDPEFVEDLTNRNAMPAITHYCVIKSQVLYLYGDVEAAHDYAERASEELQYIAGHVSTAVHEFYAILIGVQRAERASELERRRLLGRMEQKAEQLAKWADSCPDNFLHKSLLVRAELARVSGDGWRAAELFDAAIETAGKNGYVQEEALARERAGLFWLEQERLKIAAVYLSEAHHGYQLWGASRKAQMLVEAHAGLIAGPAAGSRGVASTSMPLFTLVSSTGAALDFAAVMKASQTISSEVELDGLVKRLVRIAVESAGAQRGYLLIAKGSEFLVEARSDFETGDHRFVPPVELASADDLPASVINYVARTNATLSVPDSREDSRFRRDDAIVRSGTRSVLCVPIRGHGQLVGMLYLENNLAPGVFTADRAEILQTIASQAAISLENSTLYQEQKATESTLRETLAELEVLKGRLESENRSLREEIDTQRSDEIVGESPAIRSLLEQITLVADTDANVLVLGESGTGKELVAREIHRRSRRSDGPMIKVNCASIPSDLYESEFFGHTKGSFTGAAKDRAGRFELADGGTLFLDEVGEIPPELQSKLLRVLQEGQFERLGGERTQTVDVRVVAATNRDLSREVQAGRFREDLFYRLNVFPIEVVPLRSRPGDIRLLAERFISMACKRMNRPPCRLTEEDVRRLISYDWPGNVRELQNAVERALILSRSGQPRFEVPLPKSVASDPQAGPKASASIRTYAELKELEQQMVASVLEATNGRVNGREGAAELLGVRPSTLFSRMKAMGIGRRM